MALVVVGFFTLAVVVLTTNRREVPRLSENLLAFGESVSAMRWDTVLWPLGMGFS